MKHPSAASAAAAAVVALALARPADGFSGGAGLLPRALHSFRAEGTALFQGRAGVASPVIERADADILPLQSELTGAKCIINEEGPASRGSSEVEPEAEETVPSSWPQALHRFFVEDPGPPLVLLSILGFIYTRLHVPAPPSVAETAIFASSVVVWWVQEYFFHRALLHSPFDWAGKAIHRAHHERNYFHVSIDPPELLLGWLFVAHLLLKAALPWHLCLSATVGYALAGLAYEFSHYIVHTKVKPPTIPQSPSKDVLSRARVAPVSMFSRWFTRTRDHHMRHHRVSDEYWYAFAVPQLDDVFGTNPDVREVRRRLKQEKDAR
ncbi:hypothetical protein ACHAXT_009051 [Thalassiosira profunda]